MKLFSYVKCHKTDSFRMTSAAGIDQFKNTRLRRILKHRVLKFTSAMCCLWFVLFISCVLSVFRVRVY